MALTVGNQNATSGMTKDVYDELRAALEPGLEDLDAATLNGMREGWKKMAYAIAKGVIAHITAHMEIRGVQTRGNIHATVSGNTAAAAPNNHQHTVNLAGTQNNVTFTQSNDGTGRVV